MPQQIIPQTSPRGPDEARRVERVRVPDGNYRASKSKWVHDRRGAYHICRPDLRGEQAGLYRDCGICERHMDVVFDSLGDTSVNALYNDCILPRRFRFKQPLHHIEGIAVWLKVNGLRIIGLAIARLRAKIAVFWIQTDYAHLLPCSLYCDFCARM